jgi:hypothetical protein
MSIGGFAAAVIVKRRHARQSEIAAAPGKFAKAEAALGRPGRLADFGDDLIGL